MPRRRPAANGRPSGAPGKAQRRARTRVGETYSGPISSL